MDLVKNAYLMQAILNYVTETKAIICGDASTVFCIDFLVHCDTKLSCYVQ